MLNTQMQIGLAELLYTVCHLYIAWKLSAKDGDLFLFLQSFKGIFGKFEDKLIPETNNKRRLTIVVE